MLELGNLIILGDIVCLSNNKLDRWKLRLNQEFCIAFPIAVCEPLNADFDGEFYRRIR